MPLLHRLEPLTRSPELDPSCIAPCLNLPAKGQLSLTASTFNDTSSFLTFLLPSNTFSFSSSFTSPSPIIMSAVYPPGGTIVQSLKRTFADVPVDEANGNAVSTVEFLEASESLTTIFGTALSQSSAKKPTTNRAFRCHWRCCFRPRQEGYPWQRRGSSHHTPFHRATASAIYSIFIE